MSAVVERSEGFAPEGKIFELPQTNRDNEQPRYLAFIGSLVDPETARSRWWTKGGGIEISSPCLRYVKNFVRKGRITPLLKDTHDFLPYSYVEKTVGANPFGAGYFPQPIPQGYVPPNLPPSQGQFQAGFGSLAVGGPSPYGSLVGRIALPGEQIVSILAGPENITQTNIQRGVVELTSLRGQPYQPQQIDEVYVDRNIWEIQKAIFPAYPNLPILLDDIERLLDDAEIHSALSTVVTEMHESLIQFRDYADATIQNVHHTMRESGNRRGYVFRYTAMDLVLLEQLGMARQDRQIRQEAAQNGGGIQKSDLVDILQAFQQSNREERDLLVKMLGKSNEPVVNETTMMAAAPQEAGYDGYPGQSGYSGFSGEVAVSPTEDMVVTNAASEGQEQTATEPATYTCECGDTFDKPQGLTMHKNRWCKLKTNGS